MLALEVTLRWKSPGLMGGSTLATWSCITLASFNTHSPGTTGLIYFAAGCDLLPGSDSCTHRLFAHLCRVGKCKMVQAGCATWGYSCLHIGPQTLLALTCSKSPCILCFLLSFHIPFPNLYLSVKKKAVMCMHSSFSFQ